MSKLTLLRESYFSQEAQPELVQLAFTIIVSWGPITSLSNVESDFKNPVSKFFDGN